MSAKNLHSLFDAWAMTTHPLSGTGIFPEEVARSDLTTQQLLRTLVATFCVSSNFLLFILVLTQLLLQAAAH